MTISGCGYACDTCHLGTTGICPGCVPDNVVASTCKIMKCLKAKGLPTCLKCPDRAIPCRADVNMCDIYIDSLRSCPLRVVAISRTAP
jgi:hypothetical protein